MDFSIIILIVFFGYRNAMRAKMKGLSPLVWGLLTVLLFFVGSFIGIVIALVAVLKNNNMDMDRLRTDNVRYSQELAGEFQQSMIANPIHGLTILMCAMGGYLLIRYILGRKPDIVQPDTNNDM